MELQSGRYRPALHIQHGPQNPAGVHVVESLVDLHERALAGHELVHQELLVEVVVHETRHVCATFPA